MKKQKNNLIDIHSELLWRRYLLKDKNGRIIETEDQLYHRVAYVAASAEFESQYGATDEHVKDTADKFYQLMAEKKFLPNSPALMNASRENGMLSACFVLPIEDSIDGIFTTVKNTALIQKAGGGTGFSFDRLRPTGDLVTSSGGTTSGPISFMKVLSEATNAIQQGAFRRGANMGCMSIHHPDILNFINAKQNPAAFNNFNISVKVPDSFMKGLFKNPDAIHVVTNLRTGKKYALPRSVKAKSYTLSDLIPIKKATIESCFTIQETWDIIVKNAWSNGEPGILFEDEINRTNTTPHIGRIESTNPCGEQPLLPYEACILGSIDVSKYVDTGRMDLDWDKLAEAIDFSVRFLDNMIDVNHYPIPEIRETTLSNRRIGLGIMGFAHALVLLGIRYGCDKSIEFAGKLVSFIKKHAHKTSELLAKERGCFPNWKGSIWDVKYHRPMRNATCSTIAPTGSISRIAGTSSGIEPIYSITTKSRILDGQEFIQLDPLVEKLGTEQGWLTERVRELLIRGALPRDIPEIPSKLAEVLVTAHEVSPEEHVLIQAACQHHTDNAVSKTANLPTEAIIEDVDKVFRLAFELNCKGITVYRDKSRDNQVISTVHESATAKIQPRPRVRTTTGKTTKFRMGCGTLYVTVNKDENGLCEVFSNLGKAGGCPAQSEATCRAISAGIRSGVDPQVMVEQLKSIRCPSTITRRKDNKDITVLSCPDAIAKALEEVIGQKSDSLASTVSNLCPECKNPLRREANCNVCDVCGYSKCG